MVSPSFATFSPPPMEPHEVRAAPDPSVVPKRVALVCGSQTPFEQAQLRGIVEYLREHATTWHFYGSPKHVSRPISSLHQWAGDGILGNLRTAEEVGAAIASGVPTVNMGGAFGTASPVATVTVDNRAVGRLAATHLASTGLSHYAFFSPNRYWYATERAAGFREQLAKQDYQAATLFLEPGATPEQEDILVLQWLESLPKPVGIFCSTDAESLRLVNAARRIGCRIPEDVALIGCDDNPLLCEFSPVTLSSISLPFEVVGYEAASLLNRLMNGTPIPQHPVLIQPSAVVARASTDVLVGIDPDVMKAIRFIRQNACRGIRIQDVLTQVSLSRRSLENHVKRAIGRTPYDEILRLRIERAKKLLASTALPLADVAKRSGFSDARQLSLTFRSKLDITPTQYRERDAGPAEETAS